ncbi:ankyrin repeat protein [Trichoderma ceciliae]
MANYKECLDRLYAPGHPETSDLLDFHYARSIVDNLLDTRENKIQVIPSMRNGEMQKRVKTLAKLLVLSDSVIQKAVSTQPHKALAWSGVSLFISFLKSRIVCNDAIFKGFSSIGNMQMNWTFFEKAYLERPTSSRSRKLEDPLVNLYSFIIEYQAAAIYYVSQARRSWAKAYLLDPDIWLQKINSIQHLNDICHGYIIKKQQYNIWQKKDLWKQDIKKSRMTEKEIIQIMEDRQSKKEERKLLKCLAKASGDYERYKNINQGRVRDTCKWFRIDDRFRKWRDNQHGNLLWVSAGPGCGKSVLSKSLIDERRLFPPALVAMKSSTIMASHSEPAIGYFFFKEGGEGPMDSTQALCAMLHQLFTHSSTSGLVSTALSKYRGNGKTLTQKLHDLWRILLESARSSSVQIICVLDGLDECGKDSRQELLALLEGLYFGPDAPLMHSKLKFLITGRPYDDLKWSFSRFSSIATYVHIDGDEKSDQIGHEINLVIDAKMKHIAGTFSNEDRNKISQRLKSMENRTYLWLHLTLSIIKKNKSEYSRSTDIEKLLSQLPSEVTDAYEKILSKSQDEEKVDALLQIVLAATRPLTLDEANYALTLAVRREPFSSYTELKQELWPQDNLKSTLQNLCGLFISIHDSKLSFIHDTAREFLVHPVRTGKWKGRLNMAKSHGILSGTCINYLLMLDPAATSMPRYDRDNEYIFLYYASFNWPLHFRSQDADSTEMYQKSARELCRKSTPQRESWACMHSFYEKDEPDLWFASRAGMAAVVNDILTQEHVDINAERGRDTVLRTMIKLCHLDILEILLDPAHGAKVTKRDVKIALENESNGAAIITLLLDKRGSEPEITNLVARVVVADKQYGAATMAMLLDRGDDVVKITEDVVKATAKSGSAETMSLLLDKRGDRGHEIKITEDIVKAAAENWKGLAIMTLLLDKRGHEITITENIVMTLLLDKRGHEITITEAIVKAAVQNYRKGLDIMTLLLDKRGYEITITRNIVKAAVKNGSIITFLLDKGWQNVKTAKDIIRIAQTEWIMEDGVVELLEIPL